jgi:hypothetical protein
LSVFWGRSYLAWNAPMHGNEDLQFMKNIYLGSKAKALILKFQTAYIYLNLVDEKIK